MSEPAAAPGIPAQEPAPRVALVISGLLLVMFLASLDQTIVATALPTIVGELGGLNHLSWVVTAYVLAQTAVTPLYGKLGDMYGRRIVLQVALVIFLLGSVLCGLSQSMFELIAFRAIQGLGGGGLMVSAQAAIGDVIPPRQRGRYTGLFVGVFGLSSVAGPLIGGFLTGALSWHWIFYINLPLGVLAGVVLGITMPGRRRRLEHQVDYLGTGLLALGLTCLVLLTTLGGAVVPWASPTIAMLALVTVVSLVLFYRVEQRAPEPVLPLRLFRNSVFATTSIVALLVGFALLGAITFLPLFQQVVRGLGPTESGLQLLPLMGGLIVSSVVCGHLITHLGRYRMFPIAGTAVAGVGLALLSTMGPHTSVFEMGVYMLVLGVGLGMVMQVLTLAVQNAVPYSELGVATAGNTLFRSIGGALGTALLGAVFANRLAANLLTDLPPGAGDGAVSRGAVDPAHLDTLAPDVRAGYLEAFSGAMGTVFMVATVFMAAAFVVTWFIREVPLRTTVRGGPGSDDAAAAGADPA
jgi:EmrB/QacA subfamily drug resistance transporter